MAAQEIFSAEPYTGDWQSRSFFFVGRPDNGTFFVFNPFYWHFSAFQSWGLTVLMMNERGRVFTYNGGLPLTRTETTSLRMDLRLGDNTFNMSGSKAHVRIELDGFSCDLRISNIFPPWKPGDGRAWHDAGRKAYNRYAVAARWALVSGSITVFGELRDVHGQCLLDSSYSVQPLDRPKLAHLCFPCIQRAGCTNAATRLYHTTDVFKSIPRLIQPLVSLFVKRSVLYRMIGYFRGKFISPDGSIEWLAMALSEYHMVK